VQAGPYSGFEIHRALRSDLGSPIVATSCVGASFGQAEPVGSPVVQMESPSFAPESGTVAFYIVGHHEVNSTLPAPAGHARIEGVTVPRFVQPSCP
jgi:hypothetical protein